MMYDWPLFDMVDLVGGRRGKVGVLVCYLDDSYDPPPVGVVAMAGYFAEIDGWKRFERDSEEVYRGWG